MVTFSESAQAAKAGIPASTNGISQVCQVLAASLLKTCLAGLVEIAFDPPPVSRKIPKPEDSGLE